MGKTTGMQDALQEVAPILDKYLSGIAGEPAIFSIVVWQRGGQVNYVTNTTDLAWLQDGFVEVAAKIGRQI